MFIKKDLQWILSGFHSVVSELESFVTRVENVADKKLQKAATLNSEAAAHLDESTQAKSVISNIKSLLGI